MPQEAELRSGDPVMVPYTPSAGNVANGQVLIAGNAAGISCVVAHKDITNNVLGSVAIGGGVYQVKVASNYAAWSKVYWDDTNAVLTTTSTNMWLFGYTVEAAAAANARVLVLHDPVI